MEGHTPENTAVIYHYWGDRGSITGLHQPLLLSIALVRRYAPSLPIYVLDMSGGRLEWSNLPQIFGFSVVPWRHCLKTPWLRGKVYWRLSSRILDIWDFLPSIGEENIVYLDSDLFPVKPLFPLARWESIDLFCCDPNNVGIYYFNKTSKKAAAFIEFWSAAIVRAIYDYQFRRKVWLACGIKPGWCRPLHDEMVHNYCRSFELSADLPPSENLRLKRGLPEDDLKNAKNLHLMQIFWPCQRGGLAMLVKELREGLETVLPPAIKEKLFPPALLKHEGWALSAFHKNEVYDEAQRILRSL